MKGNGKKKILIGAITILFSFLLFSFTMISNAEEVTVVGTWDVSADDGTSNVTATLYSDGKMVISGTGNMESYSGSGETPYNAYISDIKTVEIQRGVTSIGYGAFSGCTSLSSITIPESVTSIGKYAFERCTSLSSITIPESVTRIGSYAFDGCTSLSSITIPDSVTSIGDGVFFGCTSLNSINVSIDNKNYSSEDGVLFDKEKTMLIKYPAGKVATEYTIPEGVTSIGEWTFRGCTSLSSITIPDSVTSIGMNAFSGCTSLSSITIPESVTRIGGYAFSGCTSLSSITIPEGVTYIGNGPFYACTSLNSINVSIDNKNYSSEDGVLFDKEKTELIQYPAGKVATEYTIPEGVTSIGSFAFNECTSLSSITIPESVTSIGNQAFYGAKLTMAVATGSENVQEMELPDIIKRAMNEGDILYSTEEFQLTNCTLNEDKTKLIVDTEVASKNTVSLYVTDGALKGLTVVVVVPSGTITYSTTSWTKDNVIAKIYVAEGETITNNSKSDTYIFERNDTFTFKYLTAEGEERQATATVENIDKLAPNISSVTGNPPQWTKENVTLTVTAQDTGSGLASEAYSFDGGKTWQTENTKTYTENTNGIVIKVKDKLGNIATYDAINITKIERMTSIIIGKAPNKTNYVEGQNFDTTGMEVKANYNSQITQTITGYTIIDGENLKAGQTTVTISYTENGVTKTTTQSITVEEKVLTEIRVTQAPNKTEYIEGQNFDTKGMKVTGTYNNGNTKDITGYTITNGEGLSASQSSVTISYTEDGVTKTTTQAITVEEKLEANLKNYEKTEENGVTYIENINPNTKIQGLIENIETNGTIKFYKENAEITDVNSKMQTGMTIKIMLGDQEINCTLVVKGDLNGDGEMGDIDLLKLVRYQAGLDTNLNGAYLKAADIYKDGTCADNKDLLKIVRVLAGLEVL